MNAAAYLAAHGRFAPSSESRPPQAEKWEAGDEKLKATYPTKAELDAWLDAT